MSFRLLHNILSPKSHNEYNNDSVLPAPTGIRAHIFDFPHYTPTENWAVLRPLYKNIYRFLPSSALAFFPALPVSFCVLPKTHFLSGIFFLYPDCPTDTLEDFPLFFYHKVYASFLQLCNIITYICTDFLYTSFRKYSIIYHSTRSEKIFFLKMRYSLPDDVFRFLFPASSVHSHAACRTGIETERK